ncbi:hypothetical protein CTAYLR_007062 [Chrysophaeum taylorii]|uniref:SH3 domain-containing protein n=1 Tax=Chrysophaeum taylorii TaxID=2483200 RepID=A0AAD7UKW3_9STRA|nr:hypothetical protein CTAYLR_007062 [Chrysophaeum taylorii]
MEWLVKSQRRISFRMRSAIGLTGAGAEDQIGAARKVFAEMATDMDVLGAGISEHLSYLRSYGSNAEKLAGVVASYAEGKFDRREEWAQAIGEAPPPPPAWGEAARVSKERWAYATNVVRRSAVAIVVTHALDPLRELAGEESAAVRRALEAYDGARAEYFHQSTSVSSEDETATAARRRDAARDQALQALETICARYDAVVVEAACALAAAHAEFLAAVADFAAEACERLPADVAAKFRSQMRDVIKVGGPAVVRKERSGARKAYELVTGKAQFEDYKRERAEADRRRRMQQEQFRRAVSEDAKPHPPGTPPQNRDTLVHSTRKPTKSIRATELLRRERPDAGKTTKDKTVVAVYDCAADLDGELSFSKGDIIRVLDDSDPGWWKGQLADEVGLFPANYVISEQVPRKSARLRSATESIKPNMDSSDHQETDVVALYDCDSEQDGELSFQKGDRLRVLASSDEDGWLLAKLQDGTTGMVPANYIAPTDA